MADYNFRPLNCLVKAFGVWVDGSDSFRNEVRLNSVSMSEGSSAISSPIIHLMHTPGIDEGNSALGRITIGVDLETTGVPRVSVLTGGRLPGPVRIFRDIGDPSLFREGTDMLLAIEFFQDTLDAYFEFDLDLNDDLPATKLGPFKYEGGVTDRQTTTFSLTRYEPTNKAFGVLDSWSLVDLVRVPGDFDGDGSLTSDDIDMLFAAVTTSSSDIEFDLNSDGRVDVEDRRFWIHDLAQTSFGDANLDGAFDSKDFVLAFQAGEYEDDIAGNSSWETGDWNLDGEFDSADFFVAFQGGTYERGVVAVSIPEPAFRLIWLVVPIIALRRRRPGNAHAPQHQQRKQ